MARTAEKTTKTAKATKGIAAKPAISAKPAAEAKPAAAAAKPAAKPADSFAIHVNKTGRVCFSAAAAARLGDAKHMALIIADGLVQMTPATKATDSTLPIRDAAGRPYVSATRQFRPLGFDGSKAINVIAKPHGAAGFAFKLS